VANVVPRGFKACLSHYLRDVQEGDAESSAVLAWLLGEPAGEAVRRMLAEAECVVSSTLTQVECARALARGVASGRMSRGDGRVRANSAAVGLPLLP